jgi:hypothetical protein
VDGVRLTFHLAGINNQNFLMRDAQTGTYWQQVSGIAISGPLRGKRLQQIGSDELLFATWRAEQPEGTVLNDVAGFVSEYAKKDWDRRMKKQPTVIRHTRAGMAQREIVLGLQEGGATCAFVYDAVLKAKLVQDNVGTQRVLLVVSADNASVRAFRIPSSQDFYRLPEGSVLLIDAQTGSKWNFQGCAVEGPSKGQCLQRANMHKDFWFDWREYHAETTVFNK